MLSKFNISQKIAMIGCFACVVAAICIFVFGSNANAFGPSFSKTADAASAATGAEYHYYNDDVQVDGSRYNFGPDRWANGASSSSNTAEWGKNDLLDAIHPGRIQAPDPALAAAVIYYAQHESGQNLLDKSTINVSYAQTEINELHQKFREDRTYWQSCAERFESMLKGYQTQVADIDSYTSQAFMQNSSASFDSAAPTVIWKETSNHDGHWLKFVSGEKVLKFRFECGYQFPADFFVSVKQDASPAVTPVTPEPTPDPGPVKDPSQDPVYQGNAERGGGYNYNSDGSINWSAGEYQPTRPTWDSGGSSSGGGDSGGGSDTPTPAPVTPVQPAKPGTKDGGDQGEFS